MLFLKLTLTSRTTFLWSLPNLFLATQVYFPVSAGCRYLTVNVLSLTHALWWQVPSLTMLASNSWGRCPLVWSSCGSLQYSSRSCDPSGVEEAMKIWWGQTVYIFKLEKNYQNKAQKVSKNRFGQISNYWSPGCFSD